VSESYPQVLGRVLRAARRKRGMTLREASTRSGGVFKPSVLAAYERGERRLSLERFQALADVYEIPAVRLLALVIRDLDGRVPDVIDVRAIGNRDELAIRAVHSFVERVMALRGIRADTVMLREGDLQVLSVSLGLSEPELRSEVEGAMDRAR
jgi:transcriptional regulator with XRE-family HTH domain